MYANIRHYYLPSNECISIDSDEWDMTIKDAIEYLDTLRFKLSPHILKYCNDYLNPVTLETKSLHLVMANRHKVLATFTSYDEALDVYENFVQTRLDFEEYHLIRVNRSGFQVIDSICLPFYGDRHHVIQNYSLNRTEYVYIDELTEDVLETHGSKLEPKQTIYNEFDPIEFEDLKVANVFGFKQVGEDELPDQEYSNPKTDETIRRMVTEYKGE